MPASNAWFKMIICKLLEVKGRNWSLHRQYESRNHALKQNQMMSTFFYLFIFGGATVWYFNYRNDGEEDSDILSINDQIYLEDTEPKTMYVFAVLVLMIFTIFSVPELTSCEVYNKALVDKGLADTYEGLPMLPGYVCRVKTFFFLTTFYQRKKNAVPQFRNSEWLCVHF